MAGFFHVFCVLVDGCESGLCGGASRGLVVIPFLGRGWGGFWGVILLHVV